MALRNYEGVVEEIAAIEKKNSYANLKDLLAFTLNMHVYIHIPSAYRKIYDTIVKQKLDGILSLGKLKNITPVQLGFNLKDKFYLIDKLYLH